MSHEPGVRSSLSRLRLVVPVLLAGATVIAVSCARDGSNPVAPGTVPASAQPPSSSNGGAPVGAVSQQQANVCHRTEGTNQFVPMTVADATIDTLIAHGDARPGDAVPGQPGMILSPDCTVLSTSSVTITFDGVASNGSKFKEYSQAGYTVSSTSGKWDVLATYGNPLPSIIFNRLATEPTLTAEVTVTAGGATFHFSSVDLYSSITTIPHVFIGRLSSTQVFSVAGEEGNTFGSFVTVPNPNASDTIDTLVIRLSNPATPCCPNPVGLDNIVVSYQP
jgi:hypothetical protein